MTNKITECLEKLMGGTEQYFSTVTILKFLNTFLFLFSDKMLIILIGIHKTFVRIANKEVLDQTSLIWVGTVCLGIFGRQLVSKFYNFY